MDMNKGTAFGIGLVIGAVIGAVCGWVFTKNRYAQIANEEIASVKECFTVPRSSIKKEPVDLTSNAAKADAALKKEDITAVVARANARPKNPMSAARTGAAPTDYTAYSKPVVMPKMESNPESELKDYPYVISPDDFADNDERTAISLFLFADGVITDDDQEPIDDPETLIGHEYVGRFGEFERDTVFVRNDQNRCDYEILRDNRTYDSLTRVELRGRNKRPDEADEDEE